MIIWPATTIILIISPSLNIDGRKAYSTRGQLFDGRIDGRFLVKRSTTPFCDAARALRRGSEAGGGAQIVGSGFGLAYPQAG